MAEAQTIFLLSPASCGGRRAGVLLNPAATFALAVQLRAEGLPLGEAFSFLSGLYFRGKLAYAHEFARPPLGAPPVLVITTNRGLLPPHHRVRREDLVAFGAVPIDGTDPRYTEPLRNDATALHDQVGETTRVVLLGSIATAKYTDILLEIFGERLLFPEAFVGRGDMSRGGLLLRCIDVGEELGYIPVRGARRRGTRPPKLEPRR